MFFERLLIKKQQQQQKDSEGLSKICQKRPRKWHEIFDVFSLIWSVKIEKTEIWNIMSFVDMVWFPPLIQHLHFGSNNKCSGNTLPFKTFSRKWELVTKFNKSFLTVYIHLWQFFKTCLHFGERKRLIWQFYKHTKM